MSVAPIAREVFKALREKWGEEDHGIKFERPEGRLDVFIYRPTARLDKTSFFSLGMANNAMENGERAELHFACNGGRSEKEEHEIATVLANLALTPFINNAPFGWGHMIGLNREFPTFKGCTAVFFSGPFTKKGWDFIKTSEGSVKILNVVPLTEAERARARSMNPIDFLQSLMEELDIFEGRDRGSE